MHDATTTALHTKECPNTETVLELLRIVEMRSFDHKQFICKRKIVQYHQKKRRFSN